MLVYTNMGKITCVWLNFRSFATMCGFTFTELEGYFDVVITNNPNLTSPGKIILSDIQILF